MEGCAMKRVLAVFFVLVMLTSGIALAEDYSSMSNDELLAILNSVRTELLTRELSLSPDEVLMENAVVKMYIEKGKEIEFSRSGVLKIPVILVSNSENEISFQIDSVMVNGWECSGIIGNVSTAGKKRDTLDINCKGAEISSIDEIEDIQIVLLAFNMNTFKYEMKTEKITIVVENGQIIKK
jgi:hypothetical protein